MARNKCRHSHVWARRRRGKAIPTRQQEWLWFVCQRKVETAPTVVVGEVPHPAEAIAQDVVLDLAAALRLSQKSYGIYIYMYIILSPLAHRCCRMIQVGRGSCCTVLWLRELLPKATKPASSRCLKATHLPELSLGLLQYGGGV